MSRTVRTTPWRLRVRDGVSESMSLYDLRYPHAELELAARQGRRPVPTRTLRRTTSWQWMALDCRGAWFSAEVSEAEGRARLQTRLAAQRLRALHHAGHSLDDVDVPPIHHRHNALWNAW